MFSSAVFVMAASIVAGQQAEAPSAHDKLKSFDALIGTWVYEGPLLEDVPDVAKKGSKHHFEGSFEWILDKSAIEENWRVVFAGGVTVSAKALTGWNGADKAMMSAGMISGGAHFLAKVTFDEGKKTWIYKSEAVGVDGTKSSETFVMTLVDADTLIVYSKDRKRVNMPPEGPKYTLKRVKR